jgi:hypothetical protein
LCSHAMIVYLFVDHKIFEFCPFCKAFSHLCSHVRKKKTMIKIAIISAYNIQLDVNNNAYQDK